jgi:hypothetical protein
LPFDDLRAVRNTMLHLLQQRFPLLQQRRELPFGGAPIGDVFDRLGYGPPWRRQIPSRLPKT